MSDAAHSKVVTHDVAAIARGLTKAQRAMVLTDSSRFHPDHLGKWKAKTWRVGSAVKEMGLTEGHGTLALPTPLGLAVRQHLVKQEGK